MNWDPALYLKFSQPRLRPALELLARVDLESPAVVYDLGCGTGSVTHILAQRWPHATVTGVDDSGEMLGRARDSSSNLRWLQQGIAAWRPDSAPDLIYSNAALHWLPDHGPLLRGLVAYLACGGVLAVQMPRNFAAPSHAAIGETVRNGPWRARLEPLLRESPVAEPMWYLELLSRVCSEVDLWQTGVLPGAAGRRSSQGVDQGHLVAAVAASAVAGRACGVRALLCTARGGGISATC